MGNFKIIVPTATTNLCTNPSLEKDTTGWAAGGSNTIAQSSAQSWSGNYSLLVTYQDTTSLAGYPTSSATFPTTSATYKVHCRLYVPDNWDGGDIEIIVGSLTGATDTTVNQYTDGTDTKDAWVYLETTITIDSDVTGNILLSTDSAPTAGRAVYLDAFQIEETDTATTYYDGSLPGGYWTGAEHGSTSVREVTSRAGGTVTDLEDGYGLYINRMFGVGMPPVHNVTVNRALLPGTERQRAKVNERIFSFTHRLIGTSMSNFHALRQALIALIAPDSVPDEQPFILQYEGAADTKRIDAYYAGGLELTGPDGFSEQVGLQFLATEPFWYGLGEEKVDLAPDSGTTNLVITRQRGTWSVLGPPASTTASYTLVWDILVEHDKSVYVCGVFTDFDDIAEADHIVHWDGSGWEVLGTVTSGSASISSIRDMTLAPDGTLYVVGDYENLAGITAADYIAQWEGGAAWAEVSPNIATGASMTLLQSCQLGYDGNLYVGGTFTTAGGVSGADNITYWDGSAWNDMSNGTDAGPINAIVIAPDNTVYIGGAFTTAGSSACNNVAYWDGSAWNVMGDGLNDTVRALVLTPDGRLIAGGDFTQNGHGATVNRVAEWNGTTWLPLSSGVDAAVHSMTMDSDGLLWVGGIFNQAGNASVANRVAIWDGSSWRGAAIDLPGDPTIRALATARKDDIWIGHNKTDTAYFSQPTTATNPGTARTYPVITIKRDGGSVTLTLEEIVNITTGRRLLFDLDLVDGEEIVIDLRPGRRSMKSNFSAGFKTSIRQQNWRMLPGSDITDFYLLSGANSLAVYTSPSAPSELSVFVSWLPNYWSLD